MLVLQLKIGESLLIGDNIKVSLMDVRTHGTEARLGITAPKEIPILRDDAHKTEEDTPQTVEK